MQNASASHEPQASPDAVSDLVRNPQGNVARMIVHHGEQTVATSIVVASKFRFGAMKLGSKCLTAQLDAVDWQRRQS